MDGVVALLLLSMLGRLAVGGTSTCHSCFGQCRLGPNGAPVDCDCQQKTCSGDACFAKIEVFAEDQLATIQKGCASKIPGGLAGCFYGGRGDSVHCYCRGSRCNSRSELDEFRPRVLSSLDCCECSEATADEDCTESCKRRCRGNYCFVDFVKKSQGCGFGLPRTLHFLNAANFSHWRGGATCLQYEAGGASNVEGCTCSKATGSCNDYVDMKAFFDGNVSRIGELKRVLRTGKINRTGKHYCYSVHHESETAVNESTFRSDVLSRSTTCEGHMCYISLSTRVIEVVLGEAEGDGQAKARLVSRHELAAGCLRLGERKKAESGCFEERLADLERPLHRHCLCEGHLCNFYHLLSGKDAPAPRYTRPRQRVRPQDEPPLFSERASSAAGAPNFSPRVPYAAALLTSVVLLRRLTNNGHN